MKSPNAARMSLTYEVSEEVKTTLFSWHKTAFHPGIFHLRKNALEYVVIDFKETADVYVGKKDIVTKEKTANIIINSNLWNAMVDAQTDPMLAVTLSDIYA